MLPRFIAVYSNVALGSAVTITSLNLLNSGILTFSVTDGGVLETAFIGGLLTSVSVAKGVILGGLWPLTLADLLHRRLKLKDDWGPLIIPTSPRHKVRPGGIWFRYTLPLASILTR